MNASVGNTGAVKAASTGTLPFTGSDIRAFALLGNLLVLIGFAMLFISHRSPKAAAFFKRLRPAAQFLTRGTGVRRLTLGPLRCAARWTSRLRCSPTSPRCARDCSSSPRAG